MSLAELVYRVRKKELSPVDLVRRSLEKAEATQSSLNCFTYLDPDGAMARARLAEKELTDGSALGPLHGIPYSVKDLIAVKNLKYTSGSRAMENNVSRVNAPAVDRANEAGAIFIGKATTSEFGCKPVGDSPLSGITRNPWNQAKTPGGSSSGSAASVVAGITPFSLGTDGGGSLRIPAAFTGLVGFKAHAGRVPVWPVSATPTLAHVGALTRDIRDAIEVFNVIAGNDIRDPFSLAGPLPDLLRAYNASVKGLRIAWSPTLGYARPDRHVLDKCLAAVRQLESLGCTIEEVDTVFSEDPADIWTAEFYAGVGTRLKPFLQENAELLDPAVAEILTQALNQEMGDYYEKVFKRYQLRDDINEFFSRYDILLSPTLPVNELDAGVNIPAHLPDRNLVSWVYYTYPFNLTGNPALSVCAGVAEENSLPVGLQVAGGSMNESAVITVAAALERLFPQGYNLPSHEQASSLI